MYKIGVIGDKDSVLGFKAVGMDVFPVSTPKDAESTLDNLAQDNYAVIFITEQVVKDIVPAIDKYRSSKLPAIIPVPGNQGSLGLGIQGVKKSVEQAVGADILFKD